MRLHIHACIMWVFPLRKKKEGCDPILVKLLKRRPHLSNPIQRYIPVSPFIVSTPPHTHMVSCSICSTFWYYSSTFTDDLSINWWCKCINTFHTADTASVNFHSGLRRPIEILVHEIEALRHRTGVVSRDVCLCVCSSIITFGSSKEIPGKLHDFCEHSFFK